MGEWEQHSNNNDYYTPKYIFDALYVVFDLDVAAPVDRTYCHVPAKEFITEDSLNKEWKGFVWMNPPWSGRGNKEAWLDKIKAHGSGIALVPDRTSAPWWQKAAREADAMLFVDGKIKFIRPDGSIAKQPGTGTVLFGYGAKAVDRLKLAGQKGLGYCIY